LHGTRLSDLLFCNRTCGFEKFGLVAGHLGFPSWVAFEDKITFAISLTSRFQPLS
jgi:hypothetical protein